MIRVPATIALFAALAPACFSEAECQRRIDAAHRDALRDAETCAWDPDGLLEPECASLDRRPLNTYYGVYCATAELSCIRDAPEVDGICFGTPESSDTDPR